MLAKRVIPTMLCRGRTLVKGRSFAGDRSVGHVLQAARVHAMRGVDELLILDIGATPERRGPDLAMIRELSAGCFIPITVGGGVKSLPDIDDLLRSGADKVAIGAEFRRNPSFVAQASDRFGAQAITVIIEHDDEDEVVGPVMDATAAGAGEIILQNRKRDGVMCGYSLGPLMRASASTVVPVIVSGGCSGPEDMLAAIKAGADACAAGALYQFTEETPRSCSAFLKANGVEVRS